MAELDAARHPSQIPMRQAGRRTVVPPVAPWAWHPGRWASGEKGPADTKLPTDLQALLQPLSTCDRMLGVFTLGLSPTGRGAVRATHWRSRSSVLRMAGASDRMAQDGLLYDGWGAEGLKSLNISNSLVDHADDAGVNRYDLTRIVAAQAKEIAYAHCTEDEMLNPMLAGNQVAQTLKP